MHLGLNLSRLGLNAPRRYRRNGEWQRQVRAAVAGAAAMYLLDPREGPRRRAQLRNQTVHLQCASADFFAKAGRDFAHRAHGIASRLAARGNTADVPDHVLVERVRSRLGRYSSHPHAIAVAAERGQVTLRGPVLVGEKNAVLVGVRRVRGIRGVTDALEVHDERDGVPSLQGIGQLLPSRRRLEFAQVQWTPSLRVLTSAGGATLAVAATRRNGPLRAGAIALGTALFFRAATNLPVRRLIGIGAGRRAVDVHKTISIRAPIEQVFALLTHFEQLPLVMDRVRGVRKTRDDRWRWTMTGPFGAPVSFEVHITKLVPNQVVAWKTVDRSIIGHAGTIHLDSHGDGTTRLDLRMSYNPVLGALGHAVARLLQTDPKHVLDADLIRIKSLLEEGKTRAHHKPVARDEVLDGPPSSIEAPHPGSPA